MPVSHLGLTVSHLASATTFYITALQPLGYRFIASKGQSIALGVYDADLFLTQASFGSQPAPTHIAFSAGDRSAVRDCYTAALKAGARPSGAPSYREDDCNCFNAAVEDIDGNTVEFIWRDNDLEQPSRQVRLMPTYTRPRPVRSQTYQTIETPEPDFRRGLQRSRTEPIESTPSKGIFGIVLGAAAGVAVGYAILKSDNRQENSGARSEWRGRQDNDYRQPTRRSTSAASGDSFSAVGRYQTGPSAVRVIQSRPYDDDDDISYTRTKVTRQSQGRRKAYETVEFGSSRYSAKRSLTMPVEQPVEPPRYSDRRSTVSDAKSSRRDSVVDGGSRSYRYHDARSSTSQVSTVKPAKKEPSYYTEPANYPLPPSIASAANSRHDAWYLPAESDDDGLGDTPTIVPEDSISCVGSSRHASRSRQSSRAGVPGNAMTLPYRSGRNEIPRSRVAYSNTGRPACI